MEIRQVSPSSSYDRMYCPSTNEIIFAPGYEEIRTNADAFIAYWHGDVLADPYITDSKLEADWKEYYEKRTELSGIDLWELVEKFLKDYNNPGWIVYECTFYGIACGPVRTLVYFVVKADTLIEEDPECEEDLEYKDE